jgi:F-type H+-transporting ATPase subunit b
MQLPVAEVSASTSLGNVIIATGALIILIVLIKKFAWGSITGVFEKRAEKISNDIDEAEKARTKAEQLAAQREAQLANSRSEAQNIITNAKASASVSRQNMIADAEEEVSRKKEQADSDIAQEKAEALSSVKGDVADLSLQIASKILNKELTPDAHQDLIDSFVSKLGDGNGAR